MKRHLLFRLWGLSLLGCLWLAAACDSTGPQPGSPFASTQQQIIGGAPDLRYPEVGALLANQRSFCTGTLIARRVVLTAAHCVDAANNYIKANQRLQFRVDTPNPKAAKGFDINYFDFDPKLFLNHPLWNTNLTNGGDIGIGILKTKITIVNPMPVNLSPLSSQWVGRSLLFLGYGLIKSAPVAESPDRKYGVEIPMVQLNADRFVNQTSGKSVCHGDSGGPALVQILGRLRVIGVNSYVNAPRVPGTERSSCTGSGTSMRTDTYSPFIQSVLKTYGDGNEPCKSNDECGVCGVCDAKKSCQPVQVPSLSTQCKPCSSDADCKGGQCYRFGNGYRCLRPCVGKGCCPTDHYCSPLQTKTGIQQLCIPFQNECPPLQCNTAKDCGPGEFCENGGCLPRPVPPQAQLCQPCKNTSECPKGGLCFGITGQKRCTQPCGQGDFCPADYVCQELYPGLPRQCLPVAGGCQLPCTFSSHCPEGQQCIAGACSPPQGGGYGDACDPTPCQSPLSCAPTLSGKRCLSPCGVPPGQAGSGCINQATCNHPMSCYSLSSETRICLLPCNSNSDCQALGGGFCNQGVCLCRSNSDCSQDHVCNTSSQQLGACAPSAKNLTCAKNTECRQFQGSGHCVEIVPGPRTFGQSCDILNNCQQGLICLNTPNGGLCFEACDANTPCKLGGQCLNLGQTRACLCSDDQDCTKPRFCQIHFQRQGLCKAGGNSNACIATKECPQGHTCVKGKCLTPKEVELLPEGFWKEPTPESTEPTKDHNETRPEPTQEPPPEEKPREPTHDAGPKDSPPKDSPPERPSLGGGCNCSTTPSTPLTSISLGCLLLLFSFRRRTTREHNP